MILLKNPAATLRIVTTTTDVIHIVVAYVDSNSASHIPEPLHVIINSIGMTTFVGVPTLGCVRAIKYISIELVGGSNNGLTINYFDGTAEYQLYQQTIFTGSHIEFVDTVGWKTLGSLGELLTSVIAPAGIGTPGIVALASMANVLQAEVDGSPPENYFEAVSAQALAALWRQAADVTDAATITLGNGGVFNLITSTATITSFVFSASSQNTGRRAIIRFNTTRIVQHNAAITSPTGADIPVQAGDVMEICSLGSGNVLILWIRRADLAPGFDTGGASAIIANATATNAATNLTCCSMTIPAGKLRVGSVYRFLGYFVAVKVGGTALPTYTCELLINAVVVASFVITPVATAATYTGTIIGWMTVRSIGAGGTAMCHIQTQNDVGATIASQLGGNNGTTTVAIDTTVARTVEMRMRMTTAVASNVLTVTQGFPEKVV